MEARRFTLDEARSLLPQLRQLLPQIQESKSKHDQLQEKASEYAQLLSSDGRIIEQGLVDFRTEREGREVYLCWKLGEPDIRWWYELDAGFAGRRPLE